MPFRRKHGEGCWKSVGVVFAVLTTMLYKSNGKNSCLCCDLLHFKLFLCHESHTVFLGFFFLVSCWNIWIDMKIVYSVQTHRRREQTFSIYIQKFSGDSSGGVTGEPVPEEPPSGRHHLRAAISDIHHFDVSSCIRPSLRLIYSGTRLTKEHRVWRPGPPEFRGWAYGCRASGATPRGGI
jgi:hypothetical protein